MARPQKVGADYFPKDTHFYEDDKVRLLRAEFGAKGMYLLDYILCDLYGKDGYYTKWDKVKCYLVSDGAGCGCSPNFVEEFISGCIRYSFFDERAFNEFGIITSPGIQRRFVRMLNSRDKFTFIEEYFLLDINDIQDVPAGILNKITIKSISNKETLVTFEKKGDNDTDNAQKKREENKLNEKKTKETIDVAAVVAAYKDNIGFVSPAVFEKICAWLDDVDESLIIYAIEQAVFNNKPNWQYINAILNNHFKAGRKTRADAENVPKAKPKEEKKSIYDHAELERRAFMKIAKGNDDI